MKTLLLLCGLVLVSGCSTTQMVTSRKVTNDPNAPINEREMVGGTVKYPSLGRPAVIAKLRADAYKKMRAHCSGPYRITSETQKMEGGESYVAMGVVQHEQDEFTYIDFQCVTEQAKR